MKKLLLLSATVFLLSGCQYFGYAISGECPKPNLHNYHLGSTPNDIAYNNQIDSKNQEALIEAQNQCNGVGK